jgi:prolyl-tRNA editing enzyme YbaK/EbsC (Cys-tRNA(Pro) deacylase)
MQLHPLTLASLEALGVSYAVMECDPDLADTAAFCEAYGVAPEDSANTILVSSKKPAGHDAACVVLATTRLDVNQRVRNLLGVRKLSFASAERTVELTDMLIGGVTPFGLPAGLRVLVDRRVMERTSIILGGGNRSSKLRIEPSALLSIPDVEVIEDLALVV